MSDDPFLPDGEYSDEFFEVSGNIDDQAVPLPDADLVFSGWRDLSLGSGQVYQGVAFDPDAILDPNSEINQLIHSDFELGRGAAASMTELLDIAALLSALENIDPMAVRGVRFSTLYEAFDYARSVAPGAELDIFLDEGGLFGVAIGASL